MNHSRTFSLRSHHEFPLGAARTSDSTTGEGSEDAPLERDWLGTKTREELEALLMSADRVIKERTRDLETATDYGQFLLEQNNSLRTRSDSLMTRASPTKSFHTSTSELRDRPTPSPRSIRKSLNFPPPSSGLRKSSVTSRPRVDDAEWEDNDPGGPLTASSSASSFVSSNASNPSTPLHGRHRLSSTNSVSSLFAPSPRTIPQTTSPTPAEVQSLKHANWALTGQLQELQADAELAERAGKKRLRQLEKEILTLKSDLERSENRNDDSEDGEFRQVVAGTGGWMGSSMSRDSSTSSLGSISERNESTPTHNPNSRFLPSQSTPTPSTSSKNFAPAFSPASTPTNALRRSPGTGFSLTEFQSLDEIEKDNEGLKSPDEKQDELVAQLVAKIDELQEANSAIEDDRTRMTERLDKAQHEVEELRKRCDEMEDIMENGVEWQARKGAIEWHPEDADLSPSRFGSTKGRAVGNQRRMGRTSSSVLGLSFSNTSISSAGSLSPSPSGSRLNSESPQANRNILTRSLGSELGSHWGGDSDIEIEDEGGIDVENEDDDLEEGDSTATASASTSTQVRYQSRRVYSEDLVEPGSLRHQPPDNDVYEHLCEAVSNFPVTWEDESIPSPPRPSHMLLKTLTWTKESEENFMGEGNYPEDVSFGVGQIESREAVELREEYARNEQKRKKWGRIRRRRYTKGKVKWKGKGKESEEQQETSGMSRRELALQRLGLSVDGDEFERYSDEDGDEGSESGRSDMSSNYDYLNSGEYDRKGTDYYPLTLRARYHPRMIASRATNKAIQHAVNFVTYIRFFVILAMALVYALWQGPKKTLGVVTGRRRIN
ncbi:hypothetical protein MNV49_004607 [Pseudohyphozyma bogoriensis]|nr:hypothetical protein MNV49_004607 [Pseudohyphozyma bogoriensis]